MLKPDPHSLLVLEKLKIISKFKNNAHLPVFKLAIEPVLTLNF